METERMNVDRWYLRAPNGHEYGPVPFDRLRIWAAQNRFAAGYGISRDRQEWQAVETVPELGMDWYVQSGSGARFGPFHPLALLDYVREGAIPPDAVVLHKGNGGSARAYQVLLEAVVDAIDQTAEEQAGLFEQIALLQEQLEEQTRVRAEAEKEAESLRKQIREWAERQEAWEAALSRQRMELEQAAAQELERLRAETERESEKRRKAEASAADWEKRARAAFEAADKAVAEAEDRRRELERLLEQERREGQRRIEELQAEMNRLREASETPSRELDRLQRELEEHNRRWQEVQEERVEWRRQREAWERRQQENDARFEKEKRQRREAEAERDAARQAAAAAETVAQNAFERIRFLEAELQSAHARLETLAQEQSRRPNGPTDQPPVEFETTAEETPSPPKTPPNARPASLISLEARAQAELRAWRNRQKNAAPLEEKAPPKITSWFPWRKP